MESDFSSNQIYSNLWPRQYPFHTFIVYKYLLSDDYNTTLPSTLVSFLDRQKSESKKLNHNYFFLRANIVLLARLKATLDCHACFSTCRRYFYTRIPAILSLHRG